MTITTFYSKAKKTVVTKDWDTIGAAFMTVFVGLLLLNCIALLIALPIKMTEWAHNADTLRNTLHDTYHVDVVQNGADSILIKHQDTGAMSNCEKKTITENSKDEALLFCGGSESPTYTVPLS